MRRGLPLIQQFWCRCTFFFSQRYWLLVTVFGLILLAVAFVTWKSWEPWSAMLAGVGGSVLATVIVSFWGPGGDEVYQSFLKLGVTEFYPDRDTFRGWVPWLREAKRHCVLLGHSHGGWCNDEGFRPALLERVQAGVKVEIFFLDPTSPAAEVRAAEDTKNIEPVLPRTRKSIRAAWEIRRELAAPKGKLTLYVYTATPSLGLTWIDDTMLVTHYLAGSNNKTSPAFRARYVGVSDSLYAVYENNVEKIRSKFSTEITEENLGQYTEEPHAQQ